MLTNIQTEQSTANTLIPLPAGNLNDGLSLGSILANSEIAVWTSNGQEMSVTTCTTFRSLLGLPDKELFSFPELFKLIGASFRPLVIGELRKACAEKQPFVSRFMTGEGSGAPRRWFKLTGKAYNPGKGEALNYSGTLTDITDEKNKEIWNNDRLAILSHELKGPLSVIRLYLQRACKISSDKKLTDAALFLDKADEQVSTMSYLMDDFLCSSAAGSGKMILKYSHFDIVGVVEEIVAPMRLKHPDHAFSISIPSWMSVTADKRKITQVICNYLSNAIKYSPGGSRIELNCRKQNGELQFSVTDNGMGISAEHWNHVFDRYYRIPGAKVKGYGLGLYLVKEIITQHGGKVWVDSDLGKGSTFSFSLLASANKSK